MLGHIAEGARHRHSSSPQALSSNPRKRLFDSMLGSCNTRLVINRIYKDRELNRKSTANGDTQGCLCQARGWWVEFWSSFGPHRSEIHGPLWTAEAGLQVSLCCFRLLTEVSKQTRACAAVPWLGCCHPNSMYRVPHKYKKAVGIDSCSLHLPSYVHPALLP